MKLSVHRDHFRSPEQAYDEMEINGLYPVEMDVPAVKNESHWHEFSTWMYVLEGEVHITDTAHDRVLVAGPGSRVDVPERVTNPICSKFCPGIFTNTTLLIALLLSGLR